MEKEYKIFICYAKEDEGKVRDLYFRLKGKGYDPWFDKESILPGQGWEYEINKAIRASRLVLACLSPSAVSKTGFIHRELEEALRIAQEHPRGQTYLIPVLIEECKVPEELSKLQWAELYSQDGFDNLLYAIQRVMGEPPPTELYTRAEALFNWYLVCVEIVDAKSKKPIKGASVELNELEVSSTKRWDRPDELILIKEVFQRIKGARLKYVTGKEGVAYFAISKEVLEFVFPKRRFVASASARGYCVKHKVLNYRRPKILKLMKILIKQNAMVLDVDGVENREPDEKIVLALENNKKD